jgi:hypothetical protein
MFNPAEGDSTMSESPTNPWESDGEGSKTARTPLARKAWAVSYSKLATERLLRRESRPGCFAWESGEIKRGRKTHDGNPRRAQTNGQITSRSPIDDPSDAEHEESPHPSGMLRRPLPTPLARCPKTPHNTLIFGYENEDSQK